MRSGRTVVPTALPTPLNRFARIKVQGWVNRSRERLLLLVAALAFAVATSSASIVTLRGTGFVHSGGRAFNIVDPCPVHEMLPGDRFTVVVTYDTSTPPDTTEDGYPRFYSSGAMTVDFGYATYTQPLLYIEIQQGENPFNQISFSGISFVSANLGTAGPCEVAFTFTLIGFESSLFSQTSLPTSFPPFSSFDPIPATGPDFELVYSIPGYDFLLSNDTRGYIDSLAQVSAPCKGLPQIIGANAVGQTWTYKGADYDGSLYHYGIGSQDPSDPPGCTYDGTVFEEVFTLFDTCSPLIGLRYVSFENVNHGADRDNFANWIFDNVGAPLTSPIQTHSCETRTNQILSWIEPTGSIVRIYNPFTASYNNIEDIQITIEPSVPETVTTTSFGVDGGPFPYGP